MSQDQGLFLHLGEPQLERLLAVARRYARTAEDARDLVQETLLRAWRGFSRVDDRTHQGAWLFVILRNQALDWARATAARVQEIPLPVAELTDLVAVDLSEPFAAFPTMREADFCDLLDQRIAAAFAALEPAFREVLILSVVAGLNYREIAAALGCPLGTVMSRMARARRALRARLSDFAVRARKVRA